LLLSFPSHVQPQKAKLIAEVWAFEMFQSGTHQDDVWSYVAALHTDRPHPHVHIVVNNRGTLNDSWFYMSREHVFNLDAMKGRMVAIAAEEGVFLEATSRAERGLMSYGPSRGEIESARKEGRMPAMRLREGRALDEALATRDRAAETMHSLSHVAALTGVPEIGERIARAEDLLRRGGVVHPFPADVEHGERADLDRQFSAWMAEAGDTIRRAPRTDRKALLDELHGYASDIARGLGDARSAQLLQLMPQSVIYGVALQGEVLTQGSLKTTLRPGMADRLRAEIMADAVGIGLSTKRIAVRMETGALNAWEERNWVRSDLSVLAARHRHDLADPDQRRRVAEDLQGFYDCAARAIERSVEASVVTENDRLIRTLRSMGRTLQTEGKVEFRGEADAERFTAELQQRYGEAIVSELAAGRTDALAPDVGDEGERRWIARAVVSAAKSHVALGLTIRQVAGAERLLADDKRLTDGKDWDY
jgi:type IV secretion system T-DNA border endonuclease VirD2